MIPYALDANDTRFTQVQGFNNGGQFFQYLKNAFDILCGEDTTAPKMLSIGLHCRLIGRPARMAALGRFIQYAQSHDKIWFTRHENVARH